MAAKQTTFEDKWKCLKWKIIIVNGGVELV
jgi:hypothetical protein